MVPLQSDEKHAVVAAESSATSWIGLVVVVVFAGSNVDVVVVAMR